LWGKVLEFVCGEGGRVGRICVRGRWTGGGRMTRVELGKSVDQQVCVK
jgi:hypothetical protein